MFPLMVGSSLASHDVSGRSVHYYRPWTLLIFSVREVRETLVLGTDTQVGDSGFITNY